MKEMIYLQLAERGVIPDDVDIRISVYTAVDLHPISATTFRFNLPPRQAISLLM